MVGHSAGCVSRLFAHPCPSWNRVVGTRHRRCSLVLREKFPWKNSLGISSGFITVCSLDTWPFTATTLYARGRVSLRRSPRERYTSHNSFLTQNDIIRLSVHFGLLLSEISFVHRDREISGRRMAHAQTWTFTTHVSTSWIINSRPDCTDRLNWWHVYWNKHCQPRMPMQASYKATANVRRSMTIR